MSGLPPHELKLSIGDPIKLLRNMDPAQGHCNGTRYHTVSLHDHVIEAKIATGVYAGNTLFIPCIPVVPSDHIMPGTMQRRQFPVRLCFGMTANMAQGQTLSRAGIYLPSDFFTHGQLYVALSRVGSRERVRITTAKGSFPNIEGVFTDNIVFHGILG